MPSQMQPLSAHLERGWDLINQGDVQGAWISAQRSLEVNEHSAEAHHLMGYVKALEGKSEEALDHYQRAIDLEDGFIEAMLSAAELLIHPVHDFESAHRLIEEAYDYAETPDELADVLLLKFDAFMHNEQRDEALAVANRFPEGPFDNPQLIFLMGRAWLDLEVLDRAEPLLLESLKRFPTQSDVHHALGTFYELQGKASEAVASFLRARQLDSDGPRVAWSLSLEAFETLVEQTFKQASDKTSELLKASVVIVSDMPGAEVVSEGIDPRAGLWWHLDPLSQRPHRLFIYQKNLERACASPSELQDELLELIEDEVSELQSTSQSPGALPNLPHIARDSREKSEKL